MAGLQGQGNGGNDHGNGRSYRSEGNGGKGSNGYHGNGGNGSGGHRGNANGSNGNGRLTSNQYKYILKLNEDLGFNRDQLDRRCLESFGTVTQYLTKSDASNLIKQMLVS